MLGGIKAKTLALKVQKTPAPMSSVSLRSVSALSRRGALGPRIYVLPEHKQLTGWERLFCLPRDLSSHWPAVFKWV
jgi:hypothetical protein